MGRACGSRKFASGIVVALLLLSSTPLTPAEEPGSDGGPSDGAAEVVGEVIETTGVANLTADDFTETAAGLEMTPPAGATEVRVNASYLYRQFGSWASDREFTVDGNRIVLDPEVTTFSSFDPEPDMTRVFTLGSKRSIRFLDRPMWISINGTANSLTLDVSDGNTSGQDIWIYKDWIWDYGIWTVEASHGEDGETIPVRQSKHFDAFVVEADHFSPINLDCRNDCNVEAVEVKKRVDGEFVPHTWEGSWDGTNKTFNLSMPVELLDFQALVESDWLGANIPHLALVEYNWTVANLSGVPFHLVNLTAADTQPDGLTLTFQEFKVDATRVFTEGSPSTLTTYGVPMFVSVSSDLAGNLSVTLESVKGINASASVGINLTYLDGFNLTTPEPENASGGRADYGVSGHRVYFDPKIEEPGLPVTYTFRENLAPAIDPNQQACSASMMLLPNGTWEHDKNEDGVKEGESFVRLKVSPTDTGTFCFEWEMWPSNLMTLHNDISHYQVFANITKPDGTIGCEIGPPGLNVTGGVVETQWRGAALCTWDAGPVPSKSVAWVHVHAIEDPDADNAVEWIGQKLGKKHEDACGPKDPAPAFRLNPAAVPSQPTPDQYAQILCYLSWAGRAAIEDIVDGETGETAPNGERGEAVITLGRREIDTSSRIEVDLVPLNDRREDSWDALEDLDALPEGPDWAGPQKIYWNISKVNEARLRYLSDKTELIDVSAHTENSNNYEAKWTKFEPHLTATARRDAWGRWKHTFDELVEFTDLSGGGLNWEAPDPLCEDDVLDLLPEEVSPDFEMHWRKKPGNPFLAIACETIENPGDVNDPGDVWFHWNVTSSNITESELNSTGNTSASDVTGQNGSIVMALVHAATTNETLHNATPTVECADTDLVCQTLAGGGIGSPLERPYDTTFRATGTGKNLFDGRAASAGDSEAIRIWFKLFWV